MWRGTGFVAGVPGFATSNYTNSPRLPQVCGESAGGESIGELAKWEVAKWEVANWKAFVDTPSHGHSA
jgi:hypothetical protein